MFFVILEWVFYISIFHGECTNQTPAPEGVFSCFYYILLATLRDTEPIGVRSATSMLTLLNPTHWTFTWNDKPWNYLSHCYSLTCNEKSLICGMFALLFATKGSAVGVFVGHLLCVLQCQPIFLSNDNEAIWRGTSGKSQPRERPQQRAPAINSTEWVRQEFLDLLRGGCMGILQRGVFPLSL